LRKINQIKKSNWKIKKLTIRLISMTKIMNKTSKKFIKRNLNQKISNKSSNNKF